MHIGNSYPFVTTSDRILYTNSKSKYYNRVEHLFQNKLYWNHSKLCARLKTKLSLQIICTTIFSHHWFLHARILSVDCVPEIEWQLVHFTFSHFSQKWLITIWHIPLLDLGEGNVPVILTYAYRGLFHCLNRSVYKKHYCINLIMNCRVKVWQTVDNNSVFVSILIVILASSLDIGRAVSLQLTFFALSKTEWANITTHPHNFYLKVYFHLNLTFISPQFVIHLWKFEVKSLWHRLVGIIMGTKVHERTTIKTPIRLSIVTRITMRSCLPSNLSESPVCIAVFMSTFNLHSSWMEAGFSPVWTPWH